jgi:hypothetical protein
MALGDQIIFLENDNDNQSGLKPTLNQALADSRPSTFSVGDANNNVSFESDGTMVFNGNGTVWDDLRFPATQIKFNPVTVKPDFDYTELGYLFPQNDATEQLFVIAQFPHSRKNGSDIYPHIHYVQDESDEPVWKIDYRWYKNGGDPTGAFITSIANTFQFTYTSGSIKQIVSFPAIDGSSIDTVSSILDVIIYRDDNIVTGDILFKEFDIHYEIDTLGSRTELTK